MKKTLLYHQFCSAINEDNTDRIRQDKINLLRRNIGELRRKRNCETDLKKKKILYYQIKIAEMQISILQIK